MTFQWLSCCRASERATVALTSCLALGVVEGLLILCRWSHVIPGIWACVLLMWGVLLCFAVLALAMIPIEIGAAGAVAWLTRRLGGGKRCTDRLWTLGIVASVLLIWLLRPHHVMPVLDLLAFLGDGIWGDDVVSKSSNLLLFVLCLGIVCALHGPSAFFRRIARNRERESQRTDSVAALIACGLSVFLLWHQATHNENQYPYIHGLVCMAALICMRWGVAAALAGRAIRGRRRWVVTMLSLLVALFCLNAILSISRATEARLMFNSDGARSIVFTLRSITDRDGDSFSPFFGGDDTDDDNADLHPGRLEIPGDGVDNDGWGGDLSIDSLGMRPRKPGPFTLPRPLRRVLCVSVDALRSDVLEHSPTLESLSRRFVNFSSARASGALTLTSYWSLVRARTPRLFFIADDGNLAGWLRGGDISSAAVLCDFFPETLVFDHSYGDISGDDLSPGPASTAATLEAWADLPRRGFFWVHYIDPHEPYEPRGSVDINDSKWERYLSEIRATDNEIARLLRGTGALEDDSVGVLIFADHGEAFGEHRGLHHGLSVYDEVLRTPLLMIIPGMEPRVVNRNVSLLDIAPTVLDLLHVSAPARLRGRSLLRLARDGNDPDYDHALAAANKMGLYCFISQDGRWKLIWDTPRSTMELYDLIADPKERDNLVDENPEKLAEIRHERDRWLGSRLLTR